MEFSTSASTSLASAEELDEDFKDAFGEISMGELLVLSEDLEDKTSSTTTNATDQGTSSSTSSSTDQSHLKNDPVAARFLTSLNVDAHYGEPLSNEDAILAVPPGDDGLMRHAIVIPDNFCSNGKLVGGLNRKDFDVSTATIKPRRASLPLTQSQLFTSLTKVPGPDGPRWIFHGVLNGWPSLRTFELVELEKKRSLGKLTPPDYLNSIRHTWSKYWTVEEDGRNGFSPAIRDKSKIYRAKLRGASWSSLGWSPDSPGFLFWFEAQRPEPRVTFGIRAIKAVGEDRCTMVGHGKGYWGL